MSAMTLNLPWTETSSGTTQQLWSKRPQCNPQCARMKHLTGAEHRWDIIEAAMVSSCVGQGESGSFTPSGQFPSWAWATTVRISGVSVLLPAKFCVLCGLPVSSSYGLNITQSPLRSQS